MLHQISCFVGFIKTNPDKPTSAPLIKAGYGGGKEGTLVINFIPLPKEQWNADKVWYRVQYKEYDPNANDEAGNWAVSSLYNRGIVTLL